MLPYIKIYSDCIDIVRELDNGARGQLFLAVLQYANDEEISNLTGATKIAFLSIKGQIDRERNAFKDLSEKRSAAGQIGAEKRWNKEEKMANAILPMANDSKNGNCHIKEKKRNEKKEKESKEAAGAAFPDSFSPKMKEAVEKWLAYKRERRDAYKPQGQQALLSQIQNRLKIWSEADVISLIDECMANGWKGIIWDRLERKPQKLQAEPTYDLDSWELLMQKQQEAMMG